MRLNPLTAILGAARPLRLEAGELLRYLPEPRRAVIARVRASDGADVAVASLHCHNARNPELVVRGARRGRRGRWSRVAAGTAMVLAGDLNAGPGHPALAALAAQGWSGATGAAGRRHRPDAGARPARWSSPSGRCRRRSARR